MKKHSKQRGFFDLGLSLALLAIFGTTALTIDASRTSQPQQQVALCSNVDNANKHDVNGCN